MFLAPKSHSTAYNYINSLSVKEIVLPDNSTIIVPKVLSRLFKLYPVAYEDNAFKTLINSDKEYFNKDIHEFSSLSIEEKAEYISGYTNLIKYYSVKYGLYKQNSEFMPDFEAMQPPNMSIINESDTLSISNNKNLNEQ
jgi:hypothetical protein